jgi:hypothetical protein
VKKSKVAPKADSGDVGFNNANLEASIQRLHRGQTYKNLSTVWITPTRGQIKPKVVSNWMAIQRPMNQPFVGPIFIEGDEVGNAYEKAFNMVLEHPELSKFKYIVTIEEDNLLPADGLLRLYESVQDFDCVAGLYWTKSSSTSQVYSQPMIYGSPAEMPRNFVPQAPIPNTIQPCNGLGMGANLWKIDSLKKKLKDMPHPWFRTVQEKNAAFTQDLWFFNEAAKYGFKCACDNRVLVGHLDVVTGQVW